MHVTSKTFIASYCSYKNSPAVVKSCAIKNTKFETPENYYSPKREFLIMTIQIKSVILGNSYKKEHYTFCYDLIFTGITRVSPMINNIYVWIYEGSIWLRQNSKVDDQYRIVSKHRAVSISRTLLLIVESASYSSSESVWRVGGGHILGSGGDGHFGSGWNFHSRIFV